MFPTVTGGVVPDTLRLLPLFPIVVGDVGCQLLLLPATIPVVTLVFTVSVYLHVYVRGYGWLRLPRFPTRLIPGYADWPRSFTLLRCGCCGY